MNIKELKSGIEGVDIYLLDQILKERYHQNDVILDAGCGKGRNLKWFYKNAFHFYGVDTNVSSLEVAKATYPTLCDNFSIQNLDSLNFKNNKFDHVICSAVLHFAKNTQHFLNMFSELIRVLKPGGSLFIRMTSIESIEEYVKPISNGVYYLPDNTNRFLLTDALLKTILIDYNLKLIAPKKYVNVNNQRCMTTLILTKS